MPGVSFNLRKLKLGVVWIHALYFFSGWRSKNLASFQTNKLRMQSSKAITITRNKMTIHAKPL